MSAMPVALLSFRPLVKGALRGFASIQIGALQINDVSVYTKDGRSWAALPSKPMIGSNGPVKDSAGKQRYQPVCAWASKESADRFSEGVCAAIDSAHPTALGDVRG